MADNSNLKKKVAGWNRGLWKVVNNWALIPGTPPDEFDALSKKLISHLTKGSDRLKIFNIISSELITRYGLSPREDEVERFAHEVIDWWERNK